MRFICASGTRVVGSFGFWSDAVKRFDRVTLIYNNLGGTISATVGTTHSNKAKGVHSATWQMDSTDRVKMRVTGNSDLYAQAKGKTLKEIFNDYTEAFESVRDACLTMQQVYEGRDDTRDYVVCPVAVSPYEDNDVQHYQFNNEVNGSSLVYAARQVHEGDVMMHVPEGYGIAPFLKLGRMVELLFYCIGFTLDEADKDLMLVVRDACAKRKGKLLIPSFAIGRTQEIVYALHRLKLVGDLPDIECFVDSPLACSATNLFRLHDDCFNEEMRSFMQENPDPFGFENLSYVRTIDDSKALNEHNRPCIIISASGMMEAGRIKHHLANNIENPKTTILCVGYCAPTTLGAKIMRGDEKVSIFGNEYKVRAALARIDAFSGHGDYSELIRYLSCQKGNKKLKKIFVVHGEDDARHAYAKHLKDAGFKQAYVPAFRETVELS